jgi:hypothetical protein
MSNLRIVSGGSLVLIGAVLCSNTAVGIALVSIIAGAFGITVGRMVGSTDESAADHRTSGLVIGACLLLFGVLASVGIGANEGFRAGVSVLGFTLTILGGGIIGFGLSDIRRANT